MKKEEIEAYLQQSNPGVNLSGRVKQATLEITVNRVSGKKEDLGIVAGYHKNPIRHYLMQLGIWFRGLKRKYGTSNHNQG